MTKTLEEVRDILKQMQVQQAEHIAQQHQIQERQMRLLDRAEQVNSGAFRLQRVASKLLTIVVPILVVCALLLLWLQYATRP